MRTSQDSADHARTIVREEGACWACNGPRDKAAVSIINRLGQDPSFEKLWERLDRAERDRDRMLNALQIVRDGLVSGKIEAPRHTKTLIHRALSRVQPVRPEVLS